MKITVSVTIQDTVDILSTQVNQRTNELMVKINRPWRTLSDTLIDTLFKVAQSVGEDWHPKLDEGWTPNFFCEE